MSKKTIGRGVPAIQEVCGKPGTSAEQILTALANQPESRDRNGTLYPHRIERRAGGNIRNLTIVTLAKGGERMSLRVICSSDARPTPGVLALISDPWGTRSMIPAKSQEGGLELRVPEVLTDQEAHRMANQIAALFVMHGHGWTNAAGRHFSEPYGELRRVRVPRAHARPYLAVSACSVPATKDHADRYSGIARGPRVREKEAVNG